MRINKLNFLFAFLSVTLLLSSCNKDESVLSKATFFPVIDINGDDFVAVEVGTTYTDESATVTVNGTAIPFETESNVDATQVGAYTVTYTAVNEDGISASQTRTVIVVDPDAADDDLSGSYQRSTNTPISVWTKDGSKPYTYHVNNPGGVANNAPFNVICTVYNVAPGIVVLPLQTVGSLAPFFATANSVGGSPLVPFNVDAAPGDVAYTWYLNGPNFGTGSRIFKKL